VISPLPVANPLNQQSVTLRVMINPLLAANPLKQQAHSPRKRKMKLRLSTFFWMIAVIGLLIGWFADHYSLQRKVDRAETKLKFLQSFDGDTKSFTR
jgi:hypothetical protein